MAKPKKERKSQATGKRHAPTGRPNGRPPKKLDRSMEHMSMDLEVVHNKDEWHGMFDLVIEFKASGNHRLAKLASEMIESIFGKNDFQFDNEVHRLPLKRLHRALIKNIDDGESQFRAIEAFLGALPGSTIAPWVVENIKPMHAKLADEVWALRMHFTDEDPTPLPPDDVRFVEFLANHSKYRSEGDFMLKYVKRRSTVAYEAVRSFIGPADAEDIASIALQKIITAGTFNITAPEVDKKAMLKKAVKDARADILRKYGAEQGDTSIESIRNREEAPAAKDLDPSLIKPSKSKVKSIGYGKKCAKRAKIIERFIRKRAA